MTKKLFIYAVLLLMATGLTTGCSSNNDSGEIRKVYQTTSVDNNRKTSTKRCQAITKKGTQCKRKAQKGSDYCWQHTKQ